MKKIICCLVLVFSFPLYADITGKKLLCIGDPEKFEFFGIEFYHYSKLKYWEGQDTGSVIERERPYKALPKRIEILQWAIEVRELFIDRKNLKA